MVVMSLLGWPCSSWRAGFRVPESKLVNMILVSSLLLPENVPEYTPLPWWCMLSMMAPRPLCRFRPCLRSLPEPELEPELELELVLELPLLFELLPLLLLLGDGV